MARISRDRDDVHIALLRGVNVGGTKKVPMLELRELARKAADEFTALTPAKPRFLAGAIGPTNRTASTACRCD